MGSLRHWKQFLVWSFLCSYFLLEGRAFAEPEAFCRCLAAGSCLPPPRALIICDAGGVVRLYNRESLMSKELRVQELLEQLQNGNPAARTNAATDLASQGPLSAGAVQALTRSLTRDDSKWVRRAAARTLGKLRSENAVSALRLALRDRDEWVVHSAAEALRKITADRRSL